jgi:hypothetical protein
VLLTVPRDITRACAVGHGYKRVIYKNLKIAYVHTCSLRFILERAAAASQVVLRHAFHHLYITSLPWMAQKATKGITALTSEIDCNQTAMGSPLVTSAVFLTAK